MREGDFAGFVEAAGVRRGDFTGVGGLWERESDFHGLVGLARERGAAFLVKWLSPNGDPGCAMNRGGATCAS